MAPARALVLVAAVWSGVAAGQTAEALGWMRKIHDATEKLSYSGRFTYEHGGRSENSRITRFVDAGGDIERLEVLDGTPREIVRTRDIVRCYLPESRVVKVERRSPDRSFPALVPERVGALARHYDITLGPTRRVAGYDCQTVLLKPRDSLRYGHRLYADVKTGMLLKAVTLDANGEKVEQFTFTQLTIGGVTRDMVRTRYATGKWRVDDAGAAPTRLEGWIVAMELPGFQKVLEIRRRMGEAKPVGQLVYFDGLAAVSIFIEPLEARREPRPAGPAGLAGMGALHVVTREVANHRVTVVGEAPAASVQRIANAVEYRRPQ